MAGRGDPRTKARWKRIRARVLESAAANNEPCALCGQPIDYTLSGRDSQGPTVDHIIALVDGGLEHDPGNLQPVHLGCNVAKENRRRHPKARLYSRNW